MDVFGASELAFNRSFFPKTYPRTLKIPGDAHVQSFASSEVPPASGCFSFTKLNLGFENRFIIWRSDGPNLYLDEYSTDHDLKESSLCINLSRSNIIPGVRMFTHMGMLILFIPTQGTIHRFMVRVARDEIISGQKSVLAFFPREHDLNLHWELRPLLTQGVATKAEISINNAGNALVVFTMASMQAVLVEFPYVLPPENLRETVLQSPRRFTMLWKWSSTEDGDGVVDVASQIHDDDGILFLIYKNGAIRVWSSDSKKCIYGTDIASIMNFNEHIEAEKYAIRSFIINGKPCLVVMAQMLNEVTFYVLRFVGGENPTFDVLFNYSLPGKRAIDYLLIPSLKEDERFILWTVTSETFDIDSTDTMFQPYLMWRCLVKRNGNSKWEKIQPAIQSQSFDELKFVFPKTLNAVKHRIFNGETYSFDVVQRALQIACKKGPVIPASYNDWSALVTYVDDYVSSGHFVECYLTPENKSSVLMLNLVNNTSAKVSAERLYESLLRYCDEFQEAGLQPLGLWYCPAVELVGVVQMCRFTVYHRGDAQMEAILRSAKNKTAITRCFQIANNFCKNNNEVDAAMSASEQQDILEHFNDHAEDLCNIIRMFAEHSPVDECKTKVVEDECVRASFTAGLLSLILRHRLLRRYKFATLIIGITKMISKLGSNETSLARTMFEAITRTHDSTLLQILTNYRIMWSSLSVRLTKSNHRISGDGSHRTTVGQAFFQTGRELVRKFDILASTSTSDDEEDSSYSRPKIPSEGESDYTSFIREVIDGSMILFWPESTTLTLPFFLAEKGYADALSKYCSDNSPFISELATAFRFYEGMAYAIQGECLRAKSAFEDVLPGIHAKDDALNIALTQLLHEPLFGGRPKIHTHVEFYLLVMDVFRQHNHNEFAINVGDMILAHANQRDPMLPKVCTDMFKLYTTTDQYTKAMEMIQRNPGEPERIMCVRELISKMLVKRKHKEIIALDYGDLADTVAELLERDCIAVTWDHNVFHVTFAFYIHRHMRTEATRLFILFAMYLLTQPQSKVVLEKRCSVLATAVGIIQCASPEYFFDFIGTVPQPPPARVAEPLLRQMYRFESPSAVQHETHVDFKVVIRRIGEDLQGVKIDLAYLRKEQLMAETRYQLAQKYVHYKEPPNDPTEIAREAIRHKLFDLAYTMLRAFKLDVCEVLEAVAYECIFIDHEEDESKRELECRLDEYGGHLGELAKELQRARAFQSAEMPEWVAFNRQFVDNTGFQSLKPHWKILNGMLHYTLQADKSHTRSLRVVAHKFLRYSKPLPDWLVKLFAHYNFGDLLYCYVEFDELEAAFNVLNSYLDTQDALIRQNQENANITVSFSQIDQLLTRAESSGVSQRKTLAQEARNKVVSVFDRYGNFAKAAAISQRAW